MSYYLDLNHPITPYLHSFCATRIFKTNEVYETRCPDFSTLIFVYSGTLKFTEVGKEITVKSGEYYIQRAETLQSGVKITDPPLYYYLHFVGTFSETERENCLPITGEFDTDIIRQLVQNIAQKNCVNNLFYANLYMHQVFEHLMLYNSYFNDKTVTLIAKYIATNCVTVNSLEDVVAHFNYSKDYIIRIFKEKFGITPYNYLKQMRINYACQLLKTSNLSVQQISEQCGYSDFSVFYKSFKQIIHSSPSDYRKMHTK